MTKTKKQALDILKEDLKYYTAEMEKFAEKIKKINNIKDNREKFRCENISKYIIKLISKLEK